MSSCQQLSTGSFPLRIDGERIVVTGASGFLGRRVVDILFRSGCNVLPVCRSKRADCHQVADYKDSPKGDVLIHLAENNNRHRVNRAGESYVQTALRTLRMLLDKGYQRVVYASSGVLYGDGSPYPCKPNDGIEINDFYTSLKRESEIAVLACGNNAVARLTNLYGPGMARNNVLSTVLSQIPGSGPVNVMDYSPIRDFLWIEDAAAGLTSLALSSECGIYNFGSGEGVSIAQLSQLALHLANQKDRQVEATRPSKNRSSIILDISATTAALGWQPVTSLTDGLRQLMDKSRFDK